MRPIRRWKTVTTAATAAFAASALGVAAAREAPPEIDLAEVDGPAAGEVIGLSTADPTGVTEARASLASPESPSSPDSPTSIDSPDSVDSPTSIDSPDSVDSPSSIDSPDSVDS